MELDALFENCLDQLNQGATVEECLAVHDSQAPDLAPLLQIASGLRRLALPPPPRDLAVAAEGRRRFLAQALAVSQPAVLSTTEALEACTEFLAAGVAVDECLRIFSEQAAELRPLLLTVVSLQTIGEPPAARDPAAIATGRERFLALAAAKNADAALSLEDAFEASLQMLGAGATPADCLQRFPQHAGRLDGLLETAAALRTTAQPAPQRAPALVAAGRRAFVRAAARYGGRRASPLEALRESLAAVVGLLRAPTLRWAVAGLMVLLMLAVGSGGVVTAANGALPGDALYPIKRVVEQVRIVTVLNTERKQQISLDLEELRRAEAIAVAEQRRVVQVEFSGFIEEVRAGQWTISDLAQPLLLTEEIDLVGDPVVGSRVLVTAQSDGRGNLLALRVVVLSSPADGLPSLAANSPTPSPTPSYTPSATPTPALVLDVATIAPVLDSTDTPTSTPSVTNTPSATPTASATPTPSPTRTPTPSATPVAPREVTVFGLIEEIHSAYWIVGGQVVRLDGNTVIDESLGLAQVGAEVQAIGWRQADGSMLATLIAVLHPAQDSVETRDFTDRIMEMTASRWLVGAVWVQINPDTEIIGNPAVGKVAHVSAERRSNQPWQAIRIVIEEEENFYHEGVIEAIGDSSWVIAGHTIAVDGNTQITGLAPQVGLHAEAQGVVRGGTAYAASIYVFEPATATPTPTEGPGTATATPTAQPSSETPTPTPEPTSATATPTPIVPAATPTPTPEPSAATPTPTSQPSVETPTPTPALPGATATPTLEPAGERLTPTLAPG